MTNKVLLVTLLTLILAGSTFSRTHAASNIVTAATMKEVEAKIEASTSRPEAVLLVFGIDYVLTAPEFKALHLPNMAKFQRLFDEMTSKLSGLQKDYLTTLVRVPEKGKLSLIEKEAPRVIKALQQKGMTVIAITDSLSGALGNDKKTIFQVRDHLQRLGIDFVKNAKPDQRFGIGVVTFRDQNSQEPYKEYPIYAHSYPMYYFGVLSSNGEHGPSNKGDALLHYLKFVSPATQERVAIKPKRIGFAPTTVIVVENDKQKLIDIQQKLQSHLPTLTFLGIEYTAGRNFSAGELSETEFRAYWQAFAEKAMVKSTAQPSASKKTSK